MPPPNDGNEYLPFVDLMSLEKVNNVTYRSTAKPFSSADSGRAYGGHVYAQAVWAAAQTVREGFIVHNVTGFFILGGLASVPFVYKVHNIRDGKSYCTRIVNVTQSEGKGICFTCTCSFKVVEKSLLDVQAEIDIWKQYDVVLKGKKPEDFEEAPGMDTPWYRERRRKTGFNEKFPGLQVQQVDMAGYNEPRDPLDRRQLIFYRTIGDMPADPNLTACAHLYASDRNSLFIVANHLNVGDSFTQMGSLAHTVAIHTPPKDYSFSSKTGAGEERPWFVKEDWTTRAAGGRGMYHCRISTMDGTHIGTVTQEGMLRRGKNLKDNASDIQSFIRRQQLKEQAKM